MCSSGERVGDGEYGLGWRFPMLEVYSVSSHVWLLRLLIISTHYSMYYTFLEKLQRSHYYRVLFSRRSGWRSMVSDTSQKRISSVITDVQKETSLAITDLHRHDFRLQDEYWNTPVLEMRKSLGGMVALGQGDLWHMN